MTREELSNYLDNLPVPSADLTVWLDHKEIYRHTSGFSDTEKTKPLTGKEHYFLYSMTKVTTCTAALMLYERGLIDIDAPVSNYLPEYAELSVNENGSIRPAKTTLTVRHLFSMTGGLDYDLDRKEIKLQGKEASTRDIVRAIAKKPLCFDPGTHFKYSLCHDVLAAIIEVASGMSFGDFLRENIWKPLGMNNTSVRRPSEELLSRIADEYDFDCLAHINLIRRYAARDDIWVDFSKYEDKLIAILKRVVERNKGLEINTSGIRQVVKEAIPDEYIVSLFKRLGGKILTIGSDAHNIAQIGMHVAEGIEVAKNSGFTEICTFENRTPIFHSI